MKFGILRLVLGASFAQRMSSSHKAHPRLPELDDGVTVQSRRADGDGLDLD